jgi:tetratricopeptide (TPR) repeat protein
LLQYDSYDGIVFFVEGLRWGHTQEASLYTSLNHNREFFREYGLRIVFWLTENEITDLAHHAPDFWAFRHYMVEFAESPTPQQVMQQALDSAWQGTGEYAGQFDDTDEKILLREALLTEMPNQEEAGSIRANLQLTLGLLNWRKGDFEKADGQIREALKLARRMQDNWFEAECFNAMALIKTSMGRSDDAIDAYKQAISLAPDQIFAWNNLGNLCIKIGRNDEALVTFMKAVDCNPRDPIAWNGLGTVYFQIGYADDAVTAFRKAIQFMPSFAQPWNGLGEVYASVGRAEDAIKAFQQAIQLNKQYLAPWLRLAELFARQERHRDAVRAYQRALQLDPRSSSVWNELGLIFSRMEAHEEAEEAFLKAIEIDRGFGVAYSNLGLLHSQQDRFKDAIAMLTRSLELLKEDKDKAAAWNRLGNVRRQMNQYEAAMFAYQKADALSQGLTPETGIHEIEAARPLETSEGEVKVELEPEPQTPLETPDEVEQAASAPSEPAPQKPVILDEMPAWIFDSPGAETVEPVNGPEYQIEKGELVTAVSPEPVPVAEVHSRSKMPPEVAEPETEEIADAFAWNEKGNHHFRRGDFEHAIQAYDRAIQLDPALGWPYSNLALSCLALGRPAEAIPFFMKALEVLTSDGEQAVCWNSLGNAYRAIGDYNNAAAAYQKAGELDPENSGMREDNETFKLGPGLESSKVWNDLGEIFFKSGDYIEAGNAFRRAMELDAGFAWPYSNLARTLAAQGRHSEAIPFYQKSIELFTEKNDKAVSWNRLGNTYRKLNDYDSAIKAFQEAVALNDDGMDLVTRTRFSLLSNCYAE